MNRDNTKTLLIVGAIGLALLGGIVLVVRATWDDLLDEQEFAEEVADASAGLERAETKEERLARVKQLAKAVSQRREMDERPDDATRDELRGTLENLSEEERAMFIELFLPDQFKRGLAKFYEENPTEEAREAKVAEMVAEMKNDFDSKSPTEHWEMKQRMESKRGRAFLKTAQSFYQAQLSSDQRDVFEPMMREMLRHVTVLAQARKPKGWKPKPP